MCDFIVTYQRNNNFLIKNIFWSLKFKAFFDVKHHLKRQLVYITMNKIYFDSSSKISLIHIYGLQIVWVWQ